MCRFFKVSLLICAAIIAAAIPSQSNAEISFVTAAGSPSPTPEPLYTIAPPTPEPLYTLAPLPPPTLIPLSSPFIATPAVLPLYPITPRRRIDEVRMCKLLRQQLEELRSTRDEIAKRVSAILKLIRMLKRVQSPDWAKALAEQTIAQLQDQRARLMTEWGALVVEIDGLKRTMKDMKC